MRKSRGDTIIEVILAVAVFSLVAVGAMSIMNHGVAMAQRSLEITLVRQQIDAQAEMLRFVSDSNAELWADLRANHLNASAQSILDSTTCPEQSGLGNWFALRPVGGSLAKIEGTNYSAAPETFAKIRDGRAEGLSVQLVAIDGGDAYDAYIQACWSGLGTSTPMTMGTIVRLYGA